MNKPWSVPREQVLEEVGANPQTGLSPAEAEDMLKKLGSN